MSSGRDTEFTTFDLRELESMFRTKGWALYSAEIKKWIEDARLDMERGGKEQYDHFAGILEALRRVDGFAEDLDYVKNLQLSEKDLEEYEDPEDED